MLLAECPELNIKQILQLQAKETPTETSEDRLFAPRKVGSQLKQHLHSLNTFTHILWSRFVTEFDSKSPASGLSAFAAKSLITLVYHLGFNASHFKLKTIVKSTDLNLKTAVEALRQSINPQNMASSGTLLLKWTARLGFLILPQFLYAESVCIWRNGLQENQAQSILIRMGWTLVRCLVELADVISVTVTGPLCLLEMLFDRDRFDRNAVQRVSVQGRKAVAWSNTVDETIAPNGVRSWDSFGASLNYLLEKLMSKDAEVVVPVQCAVAIRTTSWGAVIDNLKGKLFVCV